MEGAEWKGRYAGNFVTVSLSEDAAPLPIYRETMSIKPTTEGYLVDIRPQGREGKRIRKRFKTKSEAQQFERWVIATEHNKEWVERPADNRTLSELIELWWRYHG